jgi:CHAD domain-containing protein
LSYEFTPEETVATGVIRCAGEQLDRAIQALSEDIRLEPVDAVHSARKAIKKERALLRLVRGSLPSSQLARDNERLRDVARTLSGLRDADVMVQTAEALEKRFTGQIPARTFEDLIDGLLSAGASGRDGSAVEELAAAAILELAEIRREIDGWEPDGDGWGVIKKGLRRSYRRGRKALRAAQAAPTSESLHAWRKRVKDHWYHLRLLTAVCGPIVNGAAQEADRLSDVLGDDHDLAVLRDRLSGRSTELGLVDVDALLPLIDRRRKQLQTEAWQLGHRIYTETPTAFERRLRRLWQAGQMARNLRTEIT